MPYVIVFEQLTRIYICIVERKAEKASALNALSIFKLIMNTTSKFGHIPIVAFTAYCRVYWNT